MKSERSDLRRLPSSSINKLKKTIDGLDRDWFAAATRACMSRVATEILYSLEFVMYFIEDEEDLLLMSLAFALKMQRRANTLKLKLLASRPTSQLSQNHVARLQTSVHKLLTAVRRCSNPHVDIADKPFFKDHNIYETEEERDLMTGLRQLLLTTPSVSPSFQLKTLYTLLKGYPEHILRSDISTSIAMQALSCILLNIARHREGFLGPNRIDLDDLTQIRISILLTNRPAFLQEEETNNSVYRRIVAKRETKLMKIWASLYTRIHKASMPNRMSLLPFSLMKYRLELLDQYDY